MELLVKPDRFCFVSENEDGDTGFVVRENEPFLCADVVVMLFLFLFSCSCFVMLLCDVSERSFEIIFVHQIVLRDVVLDNDILLNPSVHLVSNYLNL